MLIPLNKHNAAKYDLSKNAAPTGGHVFQTTVTNFELVRNIIGTNLTKVLTGTNTMTPCDDGTINVASRVLTRKNAPPPDRKINVASRVLTRKNAPPPGGHVF
ncbi:hypothetical protein DPMN_177303 [Dreissena polymorpha]|uniref:Uncharacterized protein n=1 Tax=Dreissena polymorpha TaxID=45954 RepID=A0A9D4ILH4_DREPO|nr:hypothetical protein DPMN_177303 [Dreissena polymorpha]